MAQSRGGSAGFFVAGLTAVAFAVIGFLAYQASAAQEAAQRSTCGGDSRPGATSPPGPSSGCGPQPGPTAPSTDPKERERERALPADSGSGERVVYSLERQRVWLVGADGQVRRTYTVWPSTVSPQPGTYEVTSRDARVTGTDGVPVENVVIFTSVDGTVVGFSSALDGSKPELDPSEEAGGIRERTADGEAMWRFASIGTKVVVVP